MSTIARIATVTQNGLMQASLADNRRVVGDMLERAAGQGADLVVLPEAYTFYGVGDGTLADKAEPLDGPTVSACRDAAGRHKCHVCCPIKLRRDGAIYNSAVMIGRGGEIVGVYDKVCPVTHSHDYTEFELGVSPGGAFPVFDLDIGRVGVQICFDLGFEENWRALADAGAQMVLWPSAYDGGFPLRAFAYIHHYWVVSSVRRGRSRIIDPLGGVVAETADAEPVAIRDVNLDFVVYHGDWNRTVRARIEAAYGDRVALTCHDPGASHVLVEPRDPSVTCAGLQREFGFESTKQYHDRHRAALAELRAGRRPQPQSAAHGDRPQYGEP